MTSSDQTYRPYDSSRPGVYSGLVSGSTSIDLVRADFIEFYDRQFHMVVRFVLFNGASLQDAEDAAQQAFLDAWTDWEKIRNPEGWIRDVARKKYWKLQAKRPPAPAGDLPDLPSAEADPGELSPATLDFLAALKKLDSEARAVNAYRIDGFTFPEIAQAMHINEQRARDIQKRSKRTLKLILGNKDWQDRRPGR